MRYTLVRTDECTGLAYWACYFVNGDASGLSDDDRGEADAFLASIQPNIPGQHTEIVSCGDETSIGRFWSPGLASHGLLADLITYSLIVYQEAPDA